MSDALVIVAALHTAAALAPLAASRSHACSNATGHSVKEAA